MLYSAETNLANAEGASKKWVFVAFWDQTIAQKHRKIHPTRQSAPNTNLPSNEMADECLAFAHTPR